MKMIIKVLSVLVLISFRSFISAFYLEVEEGSVITADGEGLANEESGCYGGANAGIGGGYESSPTLYLFFIFTLVLMVN